MVLPWSLPLAGLLPGLVRLMAVGDIDQRNVVVAARWTLTPLGGTELGPGDTLAAAGVRHGDVLLVGSPVLDGPLLDDAAVPDARARLAELREVRGSFWRPMTRWRLTGWIAVATAALMVLPAWQLPSRWPTAALAGTVAVITGGTALARYRTDRACAATGLLVTYLWAAFAGLTAAALPGAQLGPPARVAAAAIAAAAAAGLCAMFDPDALVAGLALVVVGGFSAAMGAGVSAGLTVTAAALVTGLIAVGAVGVLPRMALSISGITDGDGRTDPSGLPERVAVADRLLLGGVIGLSIVAVGGALPGALSADPGQLATTAGMGVLLVLRARIFSRVILAVVVRVGGMAVLGTGWAGLFGAYPEFRPVLVVFGILVTSGAAVAFPADVIRSAVASARSNGLVTAAEQCLVVVLVLVSAGALGLADWATAVLG